MRTKGTALQDKLSDSILEMDRLMAISHQEEDYAQLFKIMGGEIEKFLKSSVFQNRSNKSFNDLIDDLTIIGIATNHIASLHEFRKTYNGYKHDPNYTRDIETARQIFEGAKAAINEIILIGHGDVSQPYIQKSKRVVWFAGWDDYVGGMTECDIFIPEYSVDFPFGIEHFNISFDGWDKVVKKFTDSGELKMGKEYVSERAYAAWKAQSDFINAGAFKGDISEFVRELSKFTSAREKGLIPFLKRENDSMSVKAAIVFSLFDSLRQDNWNRPQDLIDEIILRSSYDYGIDIGSRYLHHFLTLVDFDKISAMKISLRKTEDILWLDDINYHKFKMTVLSSDLNIAVDAEQRILTKIK